MVLISRAMFFGRIPIWHTEFLLHAEPNRLVMVKRGRRAGINGY